MYGVCYALCIILQSVLYPNASRLRIYNITHTHTYGFSRSSAAHTRTYLQTYISWMHMVVLVLGRSFRISFVSYTFANIWYAKAHTTTPTEMYWCKIGCIVCDSLQCGVIYLSCSCLEAQRAKVKLHMRLVLSQKSMRSHLIKSDNTFYNKLYFACSRTPPHTHRHVSDIFAKHKTAILHIFVIKNRRLNRFYLICGKLPAQFFFVREIILWMGKCKPQKSEKKSLCQFVL